MRRQLARIEAYVAEHGDRLGALGPPDPPPAVRIPDASAAALDLAAEGIRTVVWATGYERRYPWLRVPVLDARGEIRHDGGVTPAPGLYVLGLPLLRRRKSMQLDGVGADARELAQQLAARSAHHQLAVA
jgi:putative flavoprotein involved in K+ transport